MKDIKGVERLDCIKCGVDECDEYMFTPQGPCGYCGCPPTKHRKMLASTDPESPEQRAHQHEAADSQIIETPELPVEDKQQTTRRRLDMTKELPENLEVNTAKSESPEVTENTSKRKSMMLGDGIIESEEKRREVLNNKKIKLHTEEAIAGASGEKKRKKIFENAKLLELMKHRNMRSQSKTVLNGIVHEAYTEYSAHQQILNAEELQSNENKLKQRFTADELKKVNLKRVSLNLVKLRRYLQLKHQVHEKLKDNYIRLSKATTIKLESPNCRASD